MMDEESTYICDVTIRNKNSPDTHSFLSSFVMQVYVYGL